MAFRPAPGSALAESAGRRGRGGTARPSTAGPNTPRVSSLGARREMFERAQPHVNIDRAEIACRRSHPSEYPAHQSASSSKVPGLHEAVDNTPAMWFAFRINAQDRSRDSRCFDFFPRRHTRRVSIHPEPSHRCHSPTAPTTRTGATNPAAASVSMSHTLGRPIRRVLRATTTLARGDRHARACRLSRHQRTPASATARSGACQCTANACSPSYSPPAQPNTLRPIGPCASRSAPAPNR